MSFPVESPQHLRSGSVGFNFGHGSSTAVSAATVTTTASTSIFSFGKTSAGFGAGSTSQQPSSAATSNESGGLFKFNPEAKTGTNYYLKYLIIKKNYFLALSMSKCVSSGIGVDVV